MEKESLHRRHFILVAIMFAVVGLTFANGPAVAQQKSAKWKPAVDTITVTAAPMPAKKLRELFRMTAFGQSFLVVSASIPVPYSDLDLAREQGAAELGRRINVAARLACQQLDFKYPSYIYPPEDGDNCEQTAAKDGMAEANVAIAAAKR